MFLSALKKISLLIGFCLVSFLLFHVFSLVGIVISAAYPIWWLLFPHNTWCLSCRMRKVGENCGWCNAHVRNHERYPKTMKSVFFNIALLLTFTILSIVVVLLETKIITRFGLLGPQKTATFTLPLRRQYKNLEIFPLKIEVSGVQTPINAVQVDLGFDPTRIQAVKIDISDSFANIFIDKQIDNENGRVRLTGGLPNPGFTSDKGSFATVYFQAGSPGPAQIAFLPTSLVMANDGKGSNVLNEYQTINYLISHESATQAEQADQSISLGPKVLGAESDSEKLIYFDEATDTNGSHVLGVTNTQEVSTHENIFMRKWFSYNQFVLMLWKTAFQF